MLRALLDKITSPSPREPSPRARSRSRSRSRRRSVDSVESFFPLTLRNGERSPLDRQPTQRNGRPTGTGYMPNKKLCPTCVRAHWSRVSDMTGQAITDCPIPEHCDGVQHDHMGAYGPVTPVGFLNTPNNKQCDSYFDIPTTPDEIEELPRTPARPQAFRFTRDPASPHPRGRPPPTSPPQRHPATTRVHDGSDR